MSYSMQQTEQNPNDPLWMGAKRTTNNNNHPSTPSNIERIINEESKIRHLQKHKERLAQFTEI